MRSIAISVIGAVIAIAVALVFSISASQTATDTDGGGNADKERIAALERDIRDMRRELSTLNASVEAIEEIVATLGERISQLGVAGNGLRATRNSKPETRNSPGAWVPESLRQLVREEVARAREEERNKKLKEWESRQPEAWEKEEFGHYAWYVHDTGIKLELTKEQKRQYYALIKENTESMGKLWEEVLREHPDADRARQSEIYGERVKETLNNTRQLVTEFLDKKQQEKYEKLCKEQEWFK